MTKICWEFLTFKRLGNPPCCPITTCFLPPVLLSLVSHPPVFASISHLLSLVSGLSYPVSRLSSLVTRLWSLVSCLPYLISCHSSLVSRILSPVSLLLSLVSCILSPVSRLLSPFPTSPHPLLNHPSSPPLFLKNNDCGLWKST